MVIIEIIKSFMADVVVLAFLGLGAWIGYHRSYRVSLLYLLLQLTSIALSGVFSGFIIYKLAPYLPQNLKFSSLVPDTFYYFVAPYEDKILGASLFILLFIVFFVIIKSIGYVFSRNYEWSNYLFKDIKFDRQHDQWLSASLTVLNHYTYALVAIIIFGFPLFDLTKPYSFNQLLLHINPYIANKVTEVYEPYQEVQKGLLVFNDELDNIFVNNKVYLESLGAFLEENPTNREEILEAFEQILPMFATSSTYLNFFSTNEIDEEDMRDYISRMRYWINKEVLTLEIFNSYYNQLICNGTYGILIEEKIITEEAVNVLLNSDMLNDENLKNLKNI